MEYDTDSLRRLVGSGARGLAASVAPTVGETSGRPAHPKSRLQRLPRAKMSFLFLSLLGVVASFEDGTAPTVPNLCNLAQEEPMYCRCSSEHFEADATGVVCYVGKPLTGSHAVFQALRRQKALVSVTFTVYGEDYRLDFVPTDSLRQLGRLEKLRFTDCNLGVLHTRALYKLSALTLLQLEGNDIIDLQPDAIAHLPRLEKLELGENKLRHVKVGWFSRLPSLTGLFLGRNQIEYVEDLAFAELGALRELELGDNFIHVVTNRTFKGLAQLTRLDLYRNKLTRLDAGIFVSMPLLEELDLKLNQISIIDPLAFDGLARLRYIYLASNQLRILPADMFVGAPNLNLVDLEQNQLVTLTWRTIHNLKYLESDEDFHMGLTGNQMACDCRLAWILRLENQTLSEKFRRELRHVSCVFGDPARGKSKLRSMSLAEARFSSDSWPLRLSGCLPHHEDRTPVGQYAALTATLVITASLLELTSLLGRSLLGNRRLGIFNGGLFFTIRLLLLAKVSTQLATLLVKTRDTRALVARAAQYERTCRQPPAHHVPLRCKTIGRALHLFVVTAFFTARWYVFLTWMVLPTFLSAALSIVTAMAAAAVTAWDSAPGILAKCFAEVFVQYLRTENLALAAAVRGKVLVVGARERNSDDLRTVLDYCRANVEAVLGMVETAQGLLGTLLLLSFGANMGVLCAVLYSLTDSSTPTGLLMSGMLYSSLRFADALDVAFASESLANEVDELKWTLRSLPFRGRRDDLARDVRSFHKILDPSAMFLRAHGFFRVNVAQMISMGAAVITYTVILIQTSQSIEG